MFSHAAAVCILVSAFPGRVELFVSLLTITFAALNCAGPRFHSHSTYSLQNANIAELFRYRTLILKNVPICALWKYRSSRLMYIHMHVGQIKEGGSTIFAHLTEPVSGISA